MPWKHADKLKVNGGEGLPANFFRRSKPPTARESRLCELEKKLYRNYLPVSYARAILARRLRPKQQGHLISRLVELRESLRQAEVGLTKIRQQIKEALRGKLPDPNL